VGLDRAYQLLLLHQQSLKEMFYTETKATVLPSTLLFAGLLQVAYMGSNVEHSEHSRPYNVAIGLGYF